MELFLAAAIGRARTELAAFDYALTLAGIADRNLIRLELGDPGGRPGCRDTTDPATLAAAGEIGSTAVYAEACTSRPGSQVWAGVGWITEPCTGRGLFVEHEAATSTPSVSTSRTSLDDLGHHRHVDFGPPQSCVIGATCTGLPSCALVVCAYAVQPWPTPNHRSTCRPTTSLTRIRR